ncbi:DNA primase [Patescibacteria group bacterium]|nr:DNA primase [Patescibacteria group bacterium]
MAKEVDLIKEKLNLVDFLRSYVSLLPAGKSLKGLCPFHQEKTPSFIVSPDRGIWHCFGCGLGGDIIKFAMLYEHLEFPEALRFLGEKAGIPIQTLSPAQQREFGILYDLQDAARDFYKDALQKNRDAQAYLRSRGLKEETLADFDIGYAPGGETLVLHLLHQGFDVMDVVRAGLAQKNVRGLYRDKFSGRAMFPIKNQVGKTVAFTGRLLPDDPSVKNATVELPKYLNSPETPIFNKSRVLYGLDKSKGPIAEARSVMIVEGQMDFLMSWQAGVQNIVAVSGTGLTPAHLERLRHLADTALVSFDNDEAGLRALERTLGNLHNFDFHVKVVDLGEFKDPADAVLADSAFFKKAVEGAEPAMRHIMKVYFSQKAYKEDDIPFQKRVLRHILGEIRTLRSAVEQNIWIKELSRLSGVSENALNEELAALGGETADDEGGGKEGTTPGSERLNSVAKRLLALALTNPDFMAKLKEYQALLPANYAAVLDDPKAEGAAFLELQGAYEFGDLDEDKKHKEFDDLMRRLRSVGLKKELTEVKRALRSPQAKGDEKETTKLLNKFSEITHKIDELNK